MENFIRRGVRRLRGSNESSRIVNEDELARRVESYGTWMYKFDLGNGFVTPTHNEYIETMNQTRYRLLFDELDARLGDRWQDVTCLDAGCNEGFFGIEVAKRGAKSVLGFDARAISIEKADFVRRQLMLGNISFHVEDIFNLTPSRHGAFDLTLCLGLLYHLEDPLGALRRLRSITKELCVIETEVLSSSGSASVHRGEKDGFVRTEAVLALIPEEEWHWNPLASVTGAAIVPNMQALRQMIALAGFGEVKQAEPFEGSAERFANAQRVMLFASV